MFLVRDSNMINRLVGDVNSPVRSCQSVDATPFYADKSLGPYIYDQAGKRYVDYVCGFGPILLGHQNPMIEKLLNEAKNLSTLGVCQQSEIDLANRIHDFMPHIEKIRFTNSGAEAAGVAVRLAKAYTKKTKIIKFIGQYHGAADPVLGYVKPGNLADNGIDPNTASQLICLPFNDIDALTAVIHAQHDQIAGIMIELFSGNMGFVPANKAFITKAKKLCEEYNIVFIADEVMTGFRVHAKGASFLYDLTPDLTMLGKVIGGGFPIGAIGGKEDIMNLLSPVGQVYHAGTFAGHPLSMQAGIIALDAIKHKGILEHCEQYIKRLCHELSALFKQKGLPFSYAHKQAMFGIFFQEDMPQRFNDINTDCQSYFKTLYHAMRKQGVLLPPAHLEAMFVTHTHDEQCLTLTLEAAKNAF